MPTAGLRSVPSTANCERMFSDECESCCCVFCCCHARWLRVENVEGCEPLDARFANVDPLYK